jgi:uncharacterized protein YndB with AHSA1/START domain
MRSSVEVTTPSERELRVSRVFNAPAGLVYEAHTKPEYVQKWLLGPPGWSMPVCEIDLRVGGRYHYVWRNDANGREFGVSGVFRELVPPERIVHTERMSGIEAVPDGPEGETLCTSTYVERDGRTTLTITILFSSKEARDGAMKSGMTGGMSMSYDRLEALMAEALG